MNINDPFGRMQGKEQRDYESLRASLQRSGVTDPAGAHLLLEKLGNRMKYGLAFILPTTLILALLLPEMRIITLAIGGLLAVWIVNASRRGKQYLERYIDEELTDSSDDQPAP
tara:strand:- start:6553 stop:6891 length:339 start_codon:yes stop_codon:yes gene_type:complete